MTIAYNLKANGYMALTLTIKDKKKEVIVWKCLAWYRGVDVAN